MLHCSSPDLSLLAGAEKLPFVAIINAYFDESGKHKDHPVVTFCGVCAPVSKIQAFEDDWKALLGHYKLTALHMKEASDWNKRLSDKIPAQSPIERIEILKSFADCINQHLELGLIEAIDVKGFNAMSARAKQGLGSPDDPYYIAFARGLVALADYVQDTDLVSLVCDEDRETSRVAYQHYRGIQAAHDEIRKKVTSLTFADDEQFLPLQAADFVAYLARREARRKFYCNSSEFLVLYEYLLDVPKVCKMEWHYMFADEKTLRKTGAELEKIQSAARTD